MNANLEIVTSFCDNTGMRLNVKKAVAKGIRSCLVNQLTTPLRVGGEDVRLILPSDLGCKISARENKVAQDIESNLEGIIKAIDGAYLKS